MIIAQIPEKSLRKIKIPSEVRKNSRGTEIYTWLSDGIFGSNCFLSCREARPHDDSSNYNNKLFLTLSLRSNHSFGDEHSIINEFSGLSEFTDMETFNSYFVPRSTLFLVDADSLHWLLPPVEEKPKIHPFICLQWEFDKDDYILTDKIKVVINQLKGEYVKIEDDRYKFLNT